MVKDAQNSRPDRSFLSYWRPVSTGPHERATALLQLLLYVPALQRTNALFASAVAYGYLVAGGRKVATSPEQIRDLARLVTDGTADVTDSADELRGWSV